MIRETVIDRVTVRSFSRICDSGAIAKLLLTARMYRLGVLIALECLENKVPMKKGMFRIKRFLPNQKYAHACYERAREMYRSAKRKGSQTAKAMAYVGIHRG